MASLDGNGWWQTKSSCLIKWILNLRCQDLFIGTKHNEINCCNIVFCCNILFEAFSQNEKVAINAWGTLLISSLFFRLYLRCLLTFCWFYPNGLAIFSADSLNGPYICEVSEFVLLAVQKQKNCASKWVKILKCNNPWYLLYEISIFVGQAFGSKTASTGEWKFWPKCNLVSCN